MHAYLCENTNWFIAAVHGINLTFVTLNELRQNIRS